MSSLSHPSQLTVVVHPWANNAYQPLLYAAVQEAEPSIRLRKINWRSKGFVGLVPRLLFYRAAGASVFHLHWPVFTPPVRRRVSRVLALYYSLFVVWLIGVVRFRFVWTMHNRSPHERQTADDERVTRAIIVRCHAIVVHSAVTASALRPLIRPATLLLNAPQGPYPTHASSEEPELIRQRHGIASRAIVFLFYGMIREYKGIPELVEAFEALPLELDVHLIIAGDCRDPDLNSAIEAAARHSARITYLRGYLPEADLANYIRAADYVCLPFREVTSSSSAIVALCYLRPIIAPLVGDLASLPRGCGVLYDPTRPDALRQALSEAAIAGPPSEDRIKSIVTFIQGCSWVPLAAATITAYVGIPENRGGVA